MSGSFSLFRVAGIQVYLHFSWLILAWFQIQSGKAQYRSVGWAIAEYIGIFAIVLLHEFGHAFACRSTGGRADRIVLWPLGGLAFVDPPLRASAVLWSIAAGPLVNVALYPLLHFAAYATGRHGWIIVSDDARRLIAHIWGINLLLLVFNILPFYPLDGGQIVRALLWFKVGPIRSLLIAAIIGVCGAICMGALAWYFGFYWTVIIAFFLVSQAMAAIHHAKQMQLDADATPPPIPFGQTRE